MSSEIRSFINGLAEGQRFELWNQLSPVTPLAGERLRPLGQPSADNPFSKSTKKTEPHFSWQAEKESFIYSLLYTKKKNVLQAHVAPKGLSTQ